MLFWVRLSQKGDFIKLKSEIHKEMAREILKDPLLIKLSTLATEENISLFLVGGYLRDLLLGSPRKDYDLTMPKDSAPCISSIEEILQLHFFKVGKEEMDTTTYRTIKGETSIDLTFLVGQTIDEDLRRRDFTINSMAFSLRDETFHATETSLEDLEQKVIRLVSDQSIDRDPLRMLRAIRYLCTLTGFRLDSDLKNEIFLKRRMVDRVPGERIKMELDQILLSPQPALGINTLDELNLLLTLFPELKGLKGLGQSNHHHLTVLSHTLLTIEKITWALEWAASKQRNISLNQEEKLSLYYSALFHDIGKADTYSQDEQGRVHFYHHEAFSCLAAERIMERLRFSNTMKQRILRLIQSHMRIHNLSWETRETALKRLVNQIGDETPLLVIHTLADKEASRGILSVQKDEVEESHSLKLLDLFDQKGIVHPSPLITGHDVMALGYPSGPKVGRILNFIKGKQVEGEIRTREDALDLLKKQFGIKPDL
jgi:tRNA nucleotidyltransferase/poly(A) polymerase